MMASIIKVTIKQRMRLLLGGHFTMRLYRLSTIIALSAALVSGAAAQPPLSCEEEAARLRFLVQHFQAGRTAAELEVARLQVLSQVLQREVARLRQIEKPGGQK